MSSCYCIGQQKEQNCDCFDGISFPVPCDGTPTILWQTDTLNPIGTFIITACSNLKAGDTLTISVNDISGNNVVATLSAEATFAYTTDLLESITVTCTAAAGGTCNVIGSLSVCYDPY